MKTEFTIILNELFKASGKTYKDVDADLGHLGCSETTFRRWLSGKTEPTISTFYKVVEYFGGNKKDVQARIGMAALDEWEQSGYKNARELMEEFNAERAKLHEAHQKEKEQMRESHEASKATMREEHAAQIEKLKSLRLELQEVFQNNIQILSGQYQKNVEYLTNHLNRVERLNDDLSARAVKAADLALAAQKRAEAAEKRADELDKRRHQVFWGMFALVIILLGIVVASIVFDIPALNWQNPAR